jgi:ABC-type antimicrobial peptide transport system permease subunit
MSSITTIVNVISYVLIAFVAVSLIVSSIMIGIITYISVLERTKEIGILRAIGASKGNISQVFNAETFIVGLFAGLIGIGITLLILITVMLAKYSLIRKESWPRILPVMSLMCYNLVTMLMLFGWQDGARFFHYSLWVCPVLLVMLVHDGIPEEKLNAV